MIRYALYLPKMNGVPLQMSAYQMRFLMALADGVNEGLSSVEVLNRYRLVSSANVVAVKRSLLDKNLIFTERKKVYLSDPVLGMC